MNSNQAKIVGMMLVRNEAWIVKMTMLIALRWLDELVILDDGSTDETPDHVVDVCRQVGPSRVHYYRTERTEPIWREMELRQALLEHARKRTPTHLAVIDADEIPASTVLPHLREIVAGCGAGHGVSLPMNSPYHSIRNRRVDGSFEPASGLFLAYRDVPGAHWRAEGDGYQHHARCPRGVSALTPAYHASQGGVMHMQFVSKRRLQVKAAYYKALETIQYPGRMRPADLNRKYDWTLRTEGMRTEPIPDTWWSSHTAELSHLDVQRDPWQYDALRILINRYGMGAFAGLDMHGVV